MTSIPPIDEGPAARGPVPSASFAAGPGGGGATTELGDLYRLLVDSVRDYAIFALDREGHVLSWNEGAQRFKGYTADEIRGRHFSIFYSAADRARGHPQEELRIAEATGSYEEEGWRFRKDGTRFWANVVITALRGDDGSLLGFAKVTRDLTERRLAAEILRQSEERFRLIVQSVKDYGIFMVDPEGRVVSWNEGAQRMKQYTAEDVIGRHFSIFYSAADRARGHPQEELRVAEATGSYEEEGWRFRKDGTRFWANVVITALRGDDGSLLGFAKVTRDLTERRLGEERRLADARRIAAEEARRESAEVRAGELASLLERVKEQARELEARREEADAANRAKSEFLAAMSHELRTPLNAIGGFAELLSMGIRGPVNEDQQRDLERILHSQRHLLGIITDILNFSRVEAGRLEYNLDSVPAGEIVHAVVAMLAVQAESKGLRLETARVDDDAVLFADRAKVEQIVLNLTSNAIKFTDPGGRVTLSARVEDGWGVIEVADTGWGIPADQLEAVFQPFVQLGRSLSNSHGGTGLGLAISRDLARAMGGDVRAQSEEGRGSKLALFLPLHGAGEAGEGR